MLAQKERQKTGVYNKCWLGASDSKHTYTNKNESAGSEWTQANRQMLFTHTHACLLRKSVSGSMYEITVDITASSKRASVTDSDESDKTHTHTDCKEWFANLPSGWRMSGWDKRRARCEMMQYSQNCKNSDNAEDCWKGFLNSAIWERKLADLKVQIIFYHKVVARC